MDSFTGHDPMNKKIVGPSSCEYCDSSSTVRCGPECDRPVLFFAKQNAPFQNAENHERESHRSLNVLWKSDSARSNHIGGNNECAAFDGNLTKNDNTKLGLLFRLF